MNSHNAHRNFHPLPSRRALVTGALAGGFVLAFRLPVKAANEPDQPPDAQRVASSREEVARVLDR